MPGVRQAQNKKIKITLITQAHWGCARSRLLLKICVVAKRMVRTTINLVGTLHVVRSSQNPLMDLKNLQFFLEDRDSSKINLVDLKMSLDPLSTFRSTF